MSDFHSSNGNIDNIKEDYKEFAKSEIAQRPDQMPTECFEFYKQNLYMFNPFNFKLEQNKPFIANNGNKGSVIISENGEKLYFLGMAYHKLADYI